MSAADDARPSTAGLTGDVPDASYTTTWTHGRGHVRFFTRADGSKMRYLEVGSGPPLLLLHTVRTQLDLFQLVIPRIWDSFTVYALDLPGMGWSDIVHDASYDEPDLRAAVVEFVTALGLSDVTLAGESMGATLALSAAVDLGDTVRNVVAFNPYDYPEGIQRGNRFAKLIVGGARLPVIGPIVTGLENTTVLRAVMRGGVTDETHLPEHFLAELGRSGRRKGYPRVARAIFRNLNTLIAARQRYPRVETPVALVYGQTDWSRERDREGVERLLSNAEVIRLPRAGHFTSLDQPEQVAHILLDATRCQSPGVFDAC